MKQKYELYLVIGGELVCLDKNEFKANKNLDIVGVYHDYNAAKLAWQAKAQASVDNAHQRYFVVPLHDAIAKM